MRNSILDSAVNQAIDKLAEKGVEGCDTKEVILACMGGIYSNTEHTRKDVKRFGWAIISTIVSLLVSIILVLIFVVV